VLIEPPADESVRFLAAISVCRVPHVTDRDWSGYVATASVAGASRWLSCYVKTLIDVGKLVFESQASYSQRLPETIAVPSRRASRVPPQHFW